MTFHYRAMTAEDVSAAAAIEATVEDGWSAQGIADALCADAAHCFVAVATGGSFITDGIFDAQSRTFAEPTDANPEILCGFCACTLVCGTVNLDAVSVAATHRRQGVARGLLLYAADTLCHKGAREIWLEARSQNIPALALYRQLGFVQNGLRRGFYTHPADDAILMARPLPLSAPLSV